MVLGPNRTLPIVGDLGLVVHLKSQECYYFPFCPFSPSLCPGEIPDALHEWKVANTLFLPPVSNMALPPVVWNPTPYGIYKLNIDGSYNPNTRSAGVGGILRDAGGTLCWKNG